MKESIKYLVIMSLAGALASCNGRMDENVSITPGLRHPTFENIPSGMLTVSNNESRDDVDDHIVRLAEKLANSRHIVSIGESEGEWFTMFGAVEDIALDQSGRVYVLDSRNNQVRIFSDGGEYIHHLGGAGSGPEEYMHLAAIDYSSDGLLIVGDRNRAVKVYSFNGETYDLLSTFIADVVLRDLCAIGEEIFVWGFDEELGTSIQVYNLTGVKLRSFGPSYKSANPMVRTSLSSRGMIACSQEARVILGAFENLPVIYGFSLDGELKWTTKLEDFNPMEMTEFIHPSGQPGLRFARPQLGQDIIGSLSTAPENAVIVQVARVADPVDYHLYLLSVYTGEGFYVASPLPRIYAVSGRVAVSASHRPFPEVKILELDGDGR